MTDQELFASINRYKKLNLAREEPVLFALETDGGRRYARLIPGGGLQVFPDARSYRVGLYAADCASAWDDAPAQVNLVWLEMCDRGDLDREDYALIKSLGLSYRGKGQWPRMRQLRPGKMPWRLDEEGRALLGAGLEAAQRLAKGRALPAAPGMLAVVRRDGVCAEAAGDLSPLPPPYQAAVMPDEMTLARLRKRPRTHKVWDATVQALPVPMRQEGDDEAAPVFPQMFLLVDEQEDVVLDMAFNSPERESYDWMAGSLMQQMLKEGRPALLRCASPRAQALFGLICQRAGVRLERTDDLPKLREALDSLLNFAQSAPED